ncbi:MAG: SAM-dependent methyltransferase [Streptosporangiales bacterium]|nr:SAM-dependent methyltransferase [Streptosporangiales bacterium]
MGTAHVRPGASSTIPGVYDYLLGGKNNLPPDREAAEALAAKAPEAFAAVRWNRFFSVRAVRFCVGAGVDQFVDVGSGFPTSPNVHEVARKVHPDARVVYVDKDPLVATHDRALNAVGKTAIVEADLRDPDAVIADPEMGLIDWTRPVGVLFVAILHFLDDHDAMRAVTGFREAMSPGSYLVVSHASPGSRKDIDEAVKTYRDHVADIWPRTPEQIAPYVTGLELVEPGLVPVQRWRPDLADPSVQINTARGLPQLADDAPGAEFVAGVARVPEPGGAADG